MFADVVVVFAGGGVVVVDHIGDDARRVVLVRSDCASSWLRHSTMRHVGAVQPVARVRAPDCPLVAQARLTHALPALLLVVSLKFLSVITLNGL